MFLHELVIIDIGKVKFDLPDLCFGDIVGECASDGTVLELGFFVNDVRVFIGVDGFALVVFQCYGDDVLVCQRDTVKVVGIGVVEAECEVDRENGNDGIDQKVVPGLFGLKNLLSDLVVMLILDKAEKDDGERNDTQDDFGTNIDVPDHHSPPLE